MTIPRDAIDKVVEDIKNIKNEITLSSFARAGDHSQNKEMILEALWSGGLERILSLLQPYLDNGGWRDISTAPKSSQKNILISGGTVNWDCSFHGDIKYDYVAIACWRNDRWEGGRSGDRAMR